MQKANWQRQPLLINSIIIKLFSIGFSGSRTCSSNDSSGKSPWSSCLLLPSFPPFSVALCSYSIILYQPLLERMQRPSKGEIFLCNFRSKVPGPKGPAADPLLLSLLGVSFNCDRLCRGLLVPGPALFSACPDSAAEDYLCPHFTEISRELFRRIFCLDIKKSNWQTT